MCVPKVHFFCERACWRRGSGPACPLFLIAVTAVVVGRTVFYEDVKHFLDEMLITLSSSPLIFFLIPPKKAGEELHRILKPIPPP